MFKNYLKIAFKVLLRRKFFTFVSLFAISFTMVVLMVAAALLDHVFGKRSSFSSFTIKRNLVSVATKRSKEKLSSESLSAPLCENSASLCGEKPLRN